MKISKVISFITACSFAFAASVPAVSAYAGEYDPGISDGYEVSCKSSLSDYRSYKDFGLITDKNCMEIIRFNTPSLIGFGGHEEKIMINGSVFSDLTVLSGNLLLAGSTNLNYGINDKLITYGDLTMDNPLKVVNRYVPELGLWSRPSVFCSGRISSESVPFNRIGDQENNINIYCGSIDTGLMDTVIYANILTFESSTESNISGNIYGNVCAAGSLNTKSDVTYVHGDLNVKGDLVLYGELVVEGNLYVGGNIIYKGMNNNNRISVNGTAYVSNYESNLIADHISNYDYFWDEFVFDRESSDLMTVDEILVRGFEDTGSVMPSYEYFYEIYCQAREDRNNRIEFIYNNIIPFEVTDVIDNNYNYNVKTQITRSARIIDRNYRGEIYVSGDESDVIYLVFPDDVDLVHTEIIVDDRIKKCYICLGKGSAVLSNVKIMPESYAKKELLSEYRIDERECTNIEIIAPSSCNVCIQSCDIVANMNMDVRNFLPGRKVENIIYNDITVSDCSSLCKGALYDFGNESFGQYSPCYQGGGFFFVRSQNQPVISCDISDETIKEGQTAEFTVKAAGDGLRYQWYYKSAGSDKFVKSSNTTDTYSIKATAARNGYEVYCEVTDENDVTVRSNTAKMTVVPAVEITAQPESVTAKAGETAVFTVKAEGDGLKYQWYYKSVGSTKFTKSSTVTDTYSITATSARNGYEVYCTVTDANGNTVKSETAKLTVNTPFLITAQPESVTMPAGETALFKVKAEGEDIKYQWYYKSAGTDKFVKSSNATDTYSIKATAARSGYEVYCTVTDSSGKFLTTEPAQLIVKSKFAVTSQPASVTKKAGETAKFTVKAGGEGLKYQWYYRSAGSSKFVKSSCTSATYSIAATAARNGFEVYCVLTDITGRMITTDNARLTVK